MSLNLLLTLAAFLALNCCTDNVAVAANAADGAIVAKAAYVFPSYEQAVVASNELKEYVSKDEYQQAANDSNFTFQKVKYLSDGLKVVAYLYQPVRVSDSKFPAIIFNRGSVLRGDIAPELITFFHRLAREGFVVLAPLYRQSDGSEGRDEVGGADVDDLMNVLPLAKSLGFIDLNNLFLYGESRGGMMTYQAIKRDFPAKAAAVFGAFTDMEALIKFRPEVYKPSLLQQLWPDFDTRKEEIFKTRSALYWPEALNVPLLIMQGGADWSVNPSQSLALAQKLQNLGKTYELVIYAADGHGLRRNQLDRDRRAIAWFKRHLKPQS